MTAITILPTIGENISLKTKPNGAFELANLPSGVMPIMTLVEATYKIAEPIVPQTTAIGTSCFGCFATFMLAGAVSKPMKPQRVIGMDLLTPLKML